VIISRNLQFRTKTLKNVIVAHITSQSLTKYVGNVMYLVFLFSLLVLMTMLYTPLHYQLA